MFFKLVFFSLFSFSLSFSVNPTVNKELEGEWKLFKYNFSKVYESKNEEEFRFNVFADNWKKIQRHNLEAALGLKSYTMKVNMFADLPEDEFYSMFRRYKYDTNSHFNGSVFTRNESFVLPKSVDWRKEGYVTPVKMIQIWDTSLPFACTGTLEGQHFRKTKKLVSLSEQQLYDCSKFACIHGEIEDCYGYIKKHGIDTEDSYPYTTKHDRCNFNPETVGATMSGYKFIKSKDEEAMKEAVARVGPITANMNPLYPSFLFYNHGVYYDPNCDDITKILFVLIVGYGTTDDGKDYWIVKNCWGTDWGDKGYILMARNKKINCGIADSTTYAII